jgi:hypothetical protein
MRILARFSVIIQAYLDGLLTNWKKKKKKQFYLLVLDFKKMFFVLVYFNSLAVCEFSYLVMVTCLLIAVDEWQVKGEARKKVYKGKWDQVVQKSTRCAPGEQ